ncbi:MAG TPA: SCO family protein [Thermoanaerobaculia bacterium]|jgi:protein SCO1/2
MKALILLSLFVCSALSAQEHHHHQHAAPAPPPQQRTYTIPDLGVQTQSGESVHFYRDLVKGKVVVMNFVFTSCTTVCPTMGATFARVQKQLGDRDVAMISVSIDPNNDTPERLTAWSRKLGAKPGWTLVTGKKPDISAILKALGLFTADPAAHSPVVLVVNDPENRWERVDGLATPSAIMAAIDRIGGPAQ